DRSARVLPRARGAKGLYLRPRRHQHRRPRPARATRRRPLSPPRRLRRPVLRDGRRRAAHQRGSGDRRRRSQRGNDGAGHRHRRSSDGIAEPVRAAFGTAQHSRALGLAAISLGFLMITLDATIVNVALGPIGSDLGGALSTAQWIVNDYTLAFAALLLSAGALADRLGLRTGFLAGLAVFAVGSAACAGAMSVD